MRFNHSILSRKNAIVGAFFLLLAVLKMWLVWAFSLTIHITEVDDDLFVAKAWEIAHGRWLGTYDAFALSKGPGYPLWIVATHALGLPLLLAQQALYVVASAFAAYALWVAFRNRLIAMATFALIVFSPMSFDSNVMQRPVRDGFYATLVLFLISFTILLWYARTSSVRRVAILSSLYGCVFGMLAITREETIVLAPLAIMPLICAFAALTRGGGPRVARLVASLSGYAVAATIVIVVVLTNYRVYRFAGIVEMNTGPYANALSAITSIEQKSYRPDIPVNRDARRRLYGVSPTFARLRPYFEGEVGRNQTRTSCRLFHHICNDIGGGWFGWAFVYGAIDAGAYRSVESARAFYASIALEVRAACRLRRIACGTERGFGTRIAPELIPALVGDTVLALVDVVGFERFNVGPGTTYPDRHDAYSKAREMTRQEITRSPFDSYEIVGNIRSAGHPVAYVVDRFGRAARSIDVSERPGSFDIFTGCVERCSLVFADARRIGRFTIAEKFDERTPLRSTFVRTASFEVEVYDAHRSMRADPFAPDARRSFLSKIAKVYQAFFPAFVSLSFGIAVAAIYAAARRSSRTAVEVPLVLLYGFIFARIAMLAIVNETFNDAFETRYLAPLYPSVIVCAIYQLALGIRIFASQGRSKSFATSVAQVV